MALFITPYRQVGVLACSLVFIVLWQIKAGILPGLDLHILGLTAATLILGWRLCLLSAMLSSLILLAFNLLSVSQLALHLVLTVIVPTLLSYTLFLLSYQFLARHFFVYIFVCAFFSAGIIACIKITLTAVFYFSIGQYDWNQLADNYVYISAIIWFPEAMLNAMAITLLITYRPYWVKTFYDKDYLDS